MSRVIQIGRRLVGPGQPCFLIAEIGVNHDGDVAVAERLIDAAAAAGFDAVKTQTFDTDELVATEAAKAPYQAARTGDGNQAEMLRALELSQADHEVLRSAAERNDVEFLSSPFDAESAAFLVRLGVPALKVASGELTNHPLLEKLGGLGLPLLVSTGMATEAEVAEAVEIVRKSGDPPLILLHCVSSYPAAARDANLRAIATLQRRFGMPVGWSDHTVEPDIAVLALAAGACVIEKHITMSAAGAGPDHAASLPVEQMPDFIARIRRAETTLGDGRKRPMEAEREVALAARRSLVAAKRISAGAVLSVGDLVARRPGNGLSPASLPQVLGRRLVLPLEPGDPLTPDHLA